MRKDREKQRGAFQAGGLEYPQTLSPHTHLWEVEQSDSLLYSLELENRKV